MTSNHNFLEFFAGGGMARLGLGGRWRCLLANDFDSAKCDAYRANFGDDDLVEGDIATLCADDLPAGRADLIWGSFPCQDLSLAGGRGGMKAARSSAFFPFWSLIEGLVASARAPRIIAIENVAGLITSNNGRDFANMIERLTRAGYRTTACILDAKTFTPQSRPRLFILGFANALSPPEASDPALDETIPSGLTAAHENLSRNAKDNWFWLGAHPQHTRNTRLSDIIDWDAPDWDAPEKTGALLSMMTAAQRARIDAIAGHGARRVGAAFRRTRTENGQAVQRLEARFDGLAGCLRTPAGGSSRQIIFAIDKGEIRSRLLNPREAARLMGLPDDYILPASATAALKLAGDGVCVPIVQWLAEAVFEPALARAKTRKAA